jgi:hypothetical protein
MFNVTHRHYKGGLYEVLFDALHTETLERLRVYRNVAGQVFARPVWLFEEQVAWPDGQRRPRFVRLAP